MIPFDGWCGRKDQKVNGHELTILIGLSAKLGLARDELAAVVPAHYAAEERIAGIMSRLGKQRAADYIRHKLPTSKNIRSGDLGEILGSEYIEDATDYEVAVNRLRWKDHRNMAMRGDDIIAIKIEKPGSKPEFLKGEVKSRVAISGPVVAEARKALRKNNSRPSPHALSFIADRLHSEDETDLADAIDDAQLKDGIALKQVAHLLFTFSGNDPKEFLTSHLQGYAGKVRQIAVGLHVGTHQKFIREVYKKVVAGGKLS
jgi:hypothetical protein